MSDPTNGQGALSSALPPDCKTETLGVAFFDLSQLEVWVSPDNDERVAAFFQKFYGIAAAHIEGSGGRIVKFMGDAGLAVFKTEDAEDVIFALCDFAKEARACAREFGLDAYLNVNVHAGPLLTGSFGPPGAERFDVIGKTVNIAARLGRRGITLSAQAFRTLPPEARKRFEKITRPVTYRLRS
jgi:class 3 adenylate cyclase